MCKWAKSIVTCYCSGRRNLDIFNNKFATKHTCFCYFYYYCSEFKFQISKKVYVAVLVTKLLTLNKALASLKMLTLSFHPCNYIIVHKGVLVPLPNVPTPRLSPLALLFLNFLSLLPSFLVHLLLR